MVYGVYGGNVLSIQGFKSASFSGGRRSLQPRFISVELFRGMEDMNLDSGMQDERNPVEDFPKQMLQAQVLAKKAKKSLDAIMIEEEVLGHQGIVKAVSEAMYGVSMGASNDNHPQFPLFTSERSYLAVNLHDAERGISFPHALHRIDAGKRAFWSNKSDAHMRGPYVSSYVVQDQPITGYAIVQVQQAQMKVYDARSIPNDSAGQVAPANENYPIQAASPGKPPYVAFNEMDKYYHAQIRKDSARSFPFAAVQEEAKQYFAQTRNNAQVLASMYHRPILVYDHRIGQIHREDSRYFEMKQAYAQSVQRAQNPLIRDYSSKDLENAVRSGVSERVTARIVLFSRVSSTGNLDALLQEKSSSSTGFLDNRVENAKVEGQKKSDRDANGLAPYLDLDGRVCEGVYDVGAYTVTEKDAKAKGVDYLSIAMKILKKRGLDVKIKTMTYVDEGTGTRVTGKIIVDRKDPKKFYHILIGRENEEVLPQYRNGEDSPLAQQAAKGISVRVVRHSEKLDYIKRWGTVNQCAGSAYERGSIQSAVQPYAQNHPPILSAVRP